MIKRKEKSITEPTEPVETPVPVQLPVSIRKLYSYATPLDKLLLLGGIVFGIIAGFALPFSARFFKDIIDSVTQYQQGKLDKLQLSISVDDVGKAHIYLGIMVFIASYISAACFTFVNERQIHRIRQEYLKAVLHQNIAYFDNLGAGEITTRITTDTSLINDGLGKLQAIVHNLTAFLSGIIVSFVAQWRVALALIAVLPVSFVILGSMTGKSGALSTKTLAVYSKSGTIAEEGITSIRTLISFNRQAKISSVYDKLLNEAEVLSNKNVFIKSVGTASFVFFIYCTYALSFFYGGELLSWGLMTSGQIVESFVAIIFGIFALFYALPYTVNISQAKAAGAKLFEAIDRVPEIDSRVAGFKPNEVKGSLSFNNIKFSYPSRPEVYIFADFNLNIKSGTSVALVGSSGSGKSTVIQLLERFYDPEFGSITLDGKDLRTLDVKWLRQQIGLVSQEPTLFSGTIAENVAIGLISTSSEHDSLDSQIDLIKDACKMANAHDFINNLPNGYNTQVGERGFLLSGGQKQRIAIARAIIKNPKILLLDEATSALDSKAEILVQEALDKASQGRTTITVAHRLSTIKNADQIIVMDKGRIVEVGNHNQLMKITEGNYKKLVNLQSVLGAKNPVKSQDPNEAIAPIHNLTHKNSKKKPGKSFETSLEPQFTDLNNLESGNQSKLLQLSTFTIFTRLYGIISSHYHLIAVATVGNTILGLNHASTALISSTLLEVFAKSGDDLIREVGFYSLLFFIVAIAVGFGHFTSFYGYGISSEKLNTRLRSSSFKAILQQEIGWFDSDENSTGKLITILSEGPTNVQGFSGTGLSPLFSSAITLLSTSIVGLVYSWKLALTIIAFLPYFLHSGYMIIMLAKKSGERNKASYAKSADMACENATAMRTVAALTKEDHIFQQYSNLLDAPLKEGYVSALTITIMNGLSQSSFFWINGLAFWYGGKLVINGEYTIKNVFVAFLALTTGANSIGSVIANSPDMNRAYESANHLFYLINRKPLIDSSESSQGKKVQPNQVKGDIKFENVQFSYPTRESIKVLKDLSFEIKAGQFVALVGPSGCGKSTVINLVERFYDVNSGKVTIDGTDVRDFHLPSIRDSISLVGQEPSLYNMSIFENIAFGAKSSSSTPTQAEVEAAAKAANIHKFIINLPQGYQTIVGGKGNQLSGGQKQRIAIARALIRNPTILLLDEATSALDAESEEVVQQALDNAKKGRTTIAIAHKLATVKNADMILVLKDGVVQEKGTHTELLEKGGIYTDMASQQSF